MQYNVIITGASGMVGRGVLLECLDSPHISNALMANRSPVTLSHHKLKEVLIPDFMQLEDARTALTGYHACFFCAGISAVGKTEEEYTRITHDLTTHFARVFLEQNPESVFVYVSGAGTDSSEKGRSMWARVKGRTENALLAMPFKSVYMFRPGYIQPMRGIKSRTGWYQAMYNIFRPIYAILKHFPASATNTTAMGQAMINVLVKGNEQKILGNREINTCSSKYDVL